MHRKSLPRDQCALYRVQSHRHLATILRVDSAALHGLARNGEANYRVYEDDDIGRWIESPSDVLKTVQRRIHDLLAQITPPEYLYSGVKGRSAVSNATRHFEGHGKLVPVVKLDIAKFYSNSDANRVYDFFYHGLQCSKQVAKLLCNITTISAIPFAERAHLPTGGVTSQILAYYSYQGMFEALSVLAAKSNTILSVLVDDMTFSGEGATLGLLNEARQIISRFGLHSKRKKEKVYAARRAKPVTGVTLTRKGPRLSNSHRQNINQLQQSLQNACVPADKAILARRLIGALSYAGQIEAQYKQQRCVLLRKLRADKATWTAMHNKPVRNKTRSRSEFCRQVEDMHGVDAIEDLRRP